VATFGNGGWATPIALVVTVLAPVRARADASCNEVFDAGVREVETPHHIYYTNSSGKGRDRTSESVFDGAAVYVNATGTWKKSASVHETMVESAREQREKLDATCTRIGSEPMDGQPSTHWHIKPTEDSDAVESHVWVDAKGLPVHQRLVMPDGGTRDVRISYVDVKAPAG